MTLQVILFAVAGVLLIVYIARRRARLRNEGSDKN
jgi:membrane protein implicated in regulation of membrane protease activity